MTPAWTAGVRRAVLSNGLRVLIQPVSGSPAAAVVTRVAAGFFDEPDEWAGISHVLEHMFFKGTSIRGVGDIARATRSAGGYLNAATAYDYTSYYAVLPARGLSTAIEVQADALQHCLLKADDLRRELGVIVEESRRKQDSAAAVSRETLHAILFDRHRIRRWRIGTEEGLLRLTRDHLVAYYKSRYVPERTIVAIAGGVDPDAALALARQHYEGWLRPRVPVAPGPDEPLRDGVRVRTLRGDVQQAQLVVGWRAVPMLDSDAIPLDLAAAILSLGRGSWLYRRVRDTGIASSVGAWSYSPSEVGVFSLGAELKTDRVRDAIREFGASVVELRERGPSAADLERARVLLRARWARRFESAEGRASELAAAEGASDVELLDREYARFLGTTAEEVRDAANRHLAPERVAAVAYLPAGEGEDLSADEIASAFTGSPKQALIQPTIKPLPRPGRRSSTPNQIGEVFHAALPGVDLLARHRGGTPTATIAVYRVRPSIDPVEHAGLAALAVRSSVRGAAGDDAAALANRFESLGGTLGTSVGSEHYGFTTTVMAEHAASAGMLLHRVLYNPELLLDDVLLERGLLTVDSRRASDDMYRRPIQLASRAAFGDSGLGLPILGLPDTVPHIPPEIVAEWHADGLATGRTTVVAVGDFEPAELLDELASVFGSDPARDVIEPVVSGEWTSMTEPRRIVEQREKAQTGLALLFRGPARRDDDRHAASVWAAYAGGLGGRLFQTLRDTHALAYTVSAYAWQRRRAGGLVTYIGTSPDREDEARERMLDEIRAFGEAAPSEKEVAGAIAYLVGQAEVRRQSAAAMVGEIGDAWLHGDGLEELLDPGSVYRRVTPDDVLAVVQKFLAGQQHAEGVVRGGL